jgi:hypothetical protein
MQRMHSIYVVYTFTRKPSRLLLYVAGLRTLVWVKTIAHLLM